MFKDCVSISFQAVSTIVPPISFVVKGCAVLVIRGIIIADARAGWSISSFTNISCHHLGAAVAPTSIICVAPKVFLSSGVTFINTWFAITWLESWLIVELIKPSLLPCYILPGRAVIPVRIRNLPSWKPYRFLTPPVIFALLSTLPCTLLAIWGVLHFFNLSREQNIIIGVCMYFYHIWRWAIVPLILIIFIGSAPPILFKGAFSYTFFPPCWHSLRCTIPPKCIFHQ